MRFDWFTKSRHPFIPAAVQVGGMMEPGPLSHPRPHPLMSGRQGRRGWRYLSPVPCRKGDFQWYPRSRQYGHWCPYCLWRGSTEDPRKDNQSHFYNEFSSFCQVRHTSCCNGMEEDGPILPQAFAGDLGRVSAEYIHWNRLCILEGDLCLILRGTYPKGGSPTRATSRAITRYFIQMMHSPPTGVSSN